MEELKAFLTNVKLEQYFGNLVENGYDDVKFMLTMKESEVIEMLADANIEKKGHIKKFIAALNIRKCIEVNAIAPQDHKAAPSSVEVPSMVKEMLLPNAVNKKQEYFNFITNKLYEDCYSLMVPDAFMRYVCNQRESRWQLQKKLDVFLNFQEQIKTSADGNCFNIRKFSAEDCQINSRTIYQAKNASEFLEKKISLVKNFEEEVNDFRVQLYNTQHEVVSWKHNELEFYTQVLQTIKKEKEELCQLAGKMSAAIARSSSISMSSAEQHEKRRAEKRKIENKAKSVKELKQRCLKSASACLSITCRRDFSGMVSKSDFSFYIEKHNLVEDGFSKLLPKLHLNGLKLLLENGVFADFDGSMQQAEKAVERMEQDLLKSSDITLKKKQRQLQKNINDSKQASLTSFFTKKN